MPAEAFREGGKVSDGADKAKGFIDGANGDNDYTYDANGSMLTDKNKDLTAANAIQYNHLNLPRQVTKTNGDYIIYTYDATGRKVRQEVFNASNQSQKSTDYLGEFIYENGILQFINTEEGRVVMTPTAGEYQYHLKDHLGNVRTTFTTLRDAEANQATLEDATLIAEQGKFLRIDNAKRVYAALLDHTNGSSPGYAERLNGSANEKYGVARSLSVMAGDTLQIEVYAKYLDPTTSNWTAALSTLASQIASGASGVVVDGGSYAASTGSFNAGYPGLLSKTDNGAPKAYLNWLIFDKNFGFITGGFKQITTAAKEAGTDVAHERVAPSSDIVINQAGYAYIYLSNEAASPVEVYFDDFKVTHIKSPVIQTDDYYPFGLTFNSYTRENSLLNRYQYNGKELQTDLSLNWLDYGKRMYMSDIGRWGVIDPLGEKGRRWSPYNYAFDNPMRFMDPDGMWPGESIWNGFKGLGNKLTSGSSYSQIGQGFKALGGMYKSAADHVTVEASKGAIASVKVGKVGVEINLGTTKVGTASTKDGLQASKSDAVTKGAEVSTGVVAVL
ncbi:MAG: RHS repeat-associated core domain-containing protein [Bacteroidota bacterium]